jgi:hypothetical protein
MNFTYLNRFIVEVCVCIYMLQHAMFLDSLATDGIRLHERFILNSVNYSGHYSHELIYHSQILQFVHRAYVLFFLSVTVCSIYFPECTNGLVFTIKMQLSCMKQKLDFYIFVL